MPAQKEPFSPLQPRPRRRRWWLRGGVMFVLLLLIVIVVVQAVLWSNVPRDVVIKQVQQQLGLVMTADSLSSGWLGHTTLRNVTLSLPLADGAFTKVPELRLTHTSLPGMALRRDMTITAMEFRQPALVVRQNDAGVWNLAEVVELLHRRRASRLRRR